MQQLLRKACISMKSLESHHCSHPKIKDRSCQNLGSSSTSQLHMLSSACWVIFHDFSYADYFQINVFKKEILSGIPINSVKQFGTRSGQTFSGLIWLQTVCKGYQGPNCLQRLSGSKLFSKVIWVQTVCKGYQQSTLAGRELEFDFACIYTCTR